MPDPKLEAVLYRHDMTRHTVKMDVMGDYVYNETLKQGFTLNPNLHVAEVHQPFRKTFFLAGTGIAVMVPIYILIIGLMLPTVSLYTMLLALTIITAPISIFLLARFCSATTQRRIYCLWREFEPLTLADPYDWDYQRSWDRVHQIHEASKADARFDTMEGNKSNSFLLNSVAWVILGLGILLALVVVIGLVSDR